MYTMSSPMNVSDKDNVLGEHHSIIFPFVSICLFLQVLFVSIFMVGLDFFIIYLSKLVKLLVSLSLRINISN